MRIFLPLLSLASAAQALYFFNHGKERTCFYEDLPKDTLVVGVYHAEEFDDHRQAWWKHDGISIHITVEEEFDNNHRVVNSRGSSAGRFTFTAAEAGNHKICFLGNSNSGNSNWQSNSGPHSGIKITLDLTMGESSALESSDKGKLEDIASRVKDLNSRLNDIRREQVFQREREAEFRDQSESTNSRVVRWIIIQLVVLGITCAWQLSHLRSFFIKQKLT